MNQDNNAIPYKTNGWMKSPVMGVVIGQLIAGMAWLSAARDLLMEAVREKQPLEGQGY